MARAQEAPVAKWTTDQIPDQSGTIAVVTGANSGLGYHTTLELARKGAKVVLGCRDEGRGNAAVARIHVQVPDAELEVRSLDLSDLTSVQAFAESVATDLPGIDVLVNNAGVMAIPKRQTTAQGFEMQLGTNHLGHVALAARLAPVLRPGARVVGVTSTAHRFGTIDFDDLQKERSYSPWSAYGQSKLANLLYGWELDRRAQQSGWPVSGLTAHPGYSATNLQTSSSGPSAGGKGRLQTLGMKIANKVIAQSDAQGALPQLYAATSPDAEGGGFYAPDRFNEQRGHPTEAKPAKGAAANRTDGTAARLWDLSEELVGVSFDPSAAG
jgi:NAD(P)-dependent dehydrogenase (short-subunit alcohol dehydrogenase family)